MFASVLDMVKKGKALIFPVFFYPSSWKIKQRQTDKVEEKATEK